MPRDPMDFTPIFPLPGERNNEFAHLDTEPEPTPRPSWREVYDILKTRKEWHRILGVVDALCAGWCMLFFVLSGYLFWLLLSAICAMLLVVRTAKCWMSRDRYPIEAVGRKLYEINAFLRNVGVKLPLAPGRHQVVVIMDVQDDAYVVWSAGTRKLPQ